MLKDLVQRSRSYRRFDQSARIPLSTLRELVDLARMSPSGGNKQPLKYMLITSSEVCAKSISLFALGGIPEGLGRS